MKIAYLAAGAAGMYCGSCLHDNTLATALLNLGEDVVLVPIYTPIRTDEADVSTPRVFFGGINAYLQQKIPFFRHTPRWLDKMFDHPALLNLLAGRGASIDPAKLGDMTVSMLRGELGNQHKELDKLVDWLLDEIKPDVVHLSNSMMLGLARKISERCGPPVICSLSGEDIFLERLTPPFYEQARELLRERAAEVQAFTVLNNYYADFMTDYLSVPRKKIKVIPHGLNLKGHTPPPKKERPSGLPLRTNSPKASPATDSPANTQANSLTALPQKNASLRIGYLARICPDKGLHLLVAACEQLITEHNLPNIELHVAGYLGSGDRKYLRQIQTQAEKGPLGGKFQHYGELDRTEKIEFFQSLDVFSTPTVYQESKGLPFLEALANGIPAVMPAHGTYPELLADTGGGLLCKPLDATDLAAKLAELLKNPSLAQQLGQAGQEIIHQRYHAAAMAKQTRTLYLELIKKD